MHRMKKLLYLFFLANPLFSSAQIADSAKREVKLQGAINFRDVGGYATKDGRHVKWGKIYRSAELNNLTDADLLKLQQLGIARVDDFRGPFEVKLAPDKIPLNATRIDLPSGSEHIGDSGSSFSKTMMKGNGDLLMLNFYSNTAPFANRYRPVFKELLQLNPDSALLFHCTAGKDRTGIAAALILYALGVNEKTIMRDYLATNYYRTSENEKAISGMVKNYGMDEATARKMMEAKEKYLNATFVSIIRQYGTVNHYLESVMGLDKKMLQKLRTLYLN